MIEIKAPKIGLNVEPYNIIEWLVSEGDLVNKGDIIVNLEAEKANFDVEAEESGFIHLLAEAENQVPIGSVIAVIFPTKEEYESGKALYNNKLKGLKKEEISSVDQIKVNQKKENQKVVALPNARKIAKDHNVDLSLVKGTGPNGTITKEDVAAFIEGIENSPKNVGKEIPLTDMKKAIAKNMMKSLNQSAQLTVMGELEMSKVLSLRNELLKKEKDLGTRITFTDLFIYFLAKILRKHDILNSSLADNKLVIWDEINIGVAVAVPAGLVVPNIKKADKKDLVTISKELKRLKEKALGKRLSLEEISGGTFTLTNLGAFVKNAYRFETVIINQPEAAILGTGGISERVVVENHQMVIKPLMTYYLTYDHQIINGEDAMHFIDSLQAEFSSDHKGII